VGQLELTRSEFKFSEIEKAYETFGKAQEHGALKVLIEME
jgi:alcohol dehydrogenase